MPRATDRRGLEVLTADECLERVGRATVGSVAFEVDDVDASAGLGWSVLVQGDAAIVEDDKEIRWLDEHSEPPWVSVGGAPAWVSVRSESISGREIVSTSEA